jgi:hypothetical protein
MNILHTQKYTISMFLHFSARLRYPQGIRIPNLKLAEKIKTVAISSLIQSAGCFIYINVLGV